MIQLPTQRLLVWLWVLELMSGCLWVVPLLISHRGNVGLLFPFAIFFLVQGVCLLVALGFVIWQPQLRKQALVGVCTPVALFVFPLVARSVGGGAPLAGLDPWNTLMGVLVGVPIAGCLFLPRYVAGILPSVIWRSRGFNLALVLLTSGLLVVNLLAGTLGVGWMMKLHSAGEQPSPFLPAL